MSELWNGFPCQSVLFEGRQGYVVAPAEGTSNGRLMVKTEYWGAFPEAVELPLLRRGFHLCFLQNDNRWGAEPDLSRKARFVRWVAEQYGLNPKTVPVGMSCGGLIAIKFAAMYPELVSCLYLDAPVLNYMSCPCGFGVGNKLEGDTIREILDALGLRSLSELLSYRDMPLDRLPQLVGSRIPAVMVAGDADTTVPYPENGLLLERAYRAAGIDLAVFLKPGCNHHPHGLADPAPVVAFLESH